ncbi:unnamed protein product [Caenorhabditis auriculariae]|uniref:Uncharacterized protein n=1 Tax=Caenorhabditis auriculariae TaxID=2777116 RepID=A0A8S1HRA8_9PELO|nr:unnamed protein product [Caenorhabditis auriculariae]
MRSDDIFHETYIRPCIIELVSCCSLSFLGNFAGQPNSLRTITYPLLSGLAFYLSRSIFSSSSAAIFNPAVLIYLAVNKRIDRIRAVSLLVVQPFGFCLGEIIFRLLVSSTLYEDYIITYELVVSSGNYRITRLQAFVLEAALTGILCLAQAKKDGTSESISSCWAFLQFVSYPLMGQSCNVSLIITKSLIYQILSPLRASSMGLLYLNVLNALMGVLIALIVKIGVQCNEKKLVNLYANEEEAPNRFGNKS